MTNICAPDLQKYDAYLAREMQRFITLLQTLNFFIWAYYRQNISLQKLPFKEPKSAKNDLGSKIAVGTSSQSYCTNHRANISANQNETRQV